MAKLLRMLLCFLALAGLIHCSLVEPALAYQEEAAHGESGEDAECCFIYCASCHHWVSPAVETLVFDFQSFSDVTAESLSLLPDPPLGAIFHPPSVF